MGSFETAISTSNGITDYASNKFMDVISGYDETMNQYTDIAEQTTKQALDAVSGMIEQALQALLEKGVDKIYDSMGINKENLQLAQDVLKLAGGTVAKLQAIVSVIPTGISTTPSTKECMTALCKSYKDMLVEQYKSLKLIYDETVNAAITCMGNIVEVAKDAVKTIIQILEDMIDEQIFKWTGYHLVEIIYMCQKGIEMWRRYRQMRKQLKENKDSGAGSGYDKSVSVKVNPEDLKTALLAWLQEQNDALYNAFMMLMMQDIIKDLKEDIEKLTNIDIKLIAEDINSLDDLVNFLESLGLNDDTPGLALTEVINRGLNGIASTVSALNTIKDNASSLASPSTATAMASMVAANTSVSVNLTKTFEILPSDMGEYTEVRIEIYKDPSKGSTLKNITKKLEGIKYNKKKVFENSQIKKISDAILEVSKSDNPISEFNITGKMDGMPRPYKFIIAYSDASKQKDNAEENNTVQEKEVNPEIDPDNIVLPEETEEIWTTGKKKKNTFQIIKMLFNTLKPMCPLLKQLAKLIENYKINKAKVQGNGHKNLAKGLQKILGFLGLNNQIDVKNTNVFTIRTYKLYTYCIDNLHVTPDTNKMAVLDEQMTNDFSEHLSYIKHKNANLVVKGRNTILYFDKENIDLEENALRQKLSYKPQIDGYMTNIDNLRIIDDTLYFTVGGKSTITSQILKAIQRGDEPYKNNIRL